MARRSIDESVRDQRLSVWGKIYFVGLYECVCVTAWILPQDIQKPSEIYKSVGLVSEVGGTQQSQPKDINVYIMCIIIALTLLLETWKI